MDTTGFSLSAIRLIILSVVAVFFFSFIRNFMSMIKSVVYVVLFLQRKKKKSTAIVWVIWTNQRNRRNSDEWSCLCVCVCVSWPTNLSNTIKTKSALPMPRVIHTRLFYVFFFCLALFLNAVGKFFFFSWFSKTIHQCSVTHFGFISCLLIDSRINGLSKRVIDLITQILYYRPFILQFHEMKLLNQFLLWIKLSLKLPESNHAII